MREISVRHIPVAARERVRSDKGGGMRKAILGTLLLFCTACDVFEGASVPYFEAQIVGAVTLDFQGDATYSLTTPANRAWRPELETFVITARDATGVGRHFLLHGWGPLEPGTYSFGTDEEAIADTRVLSAFYIDRDGDWHESYASISGSITITKTGEVISGTFQFTGVRYCAYPDGYTDVSERIGSCYPRELDLSAPEIAVDGRFEAVPHSTEGVIDL
jgi:hypothetical protein